MSSSYPKHIAIILDGNRRWAKLRGLPSWKGHYKGLQVVRQLSGWAKELRIQELTLYSLSTENFHRDKKEVGYLMKQLLKELQRLEKDPSLAKEKIRIRIIGRTSSFPKDIQQLMKRLMQKTRKHDKLILNLALGYGGRQEIVDALQKISSKIRKGMVTPKEVDEDLITQHLYLQSEPDIIIRPGGEKRISNFLIWQGHYSEWFFISKLWPEFTKTDFKSIITQYTQRKRRFGT